MGRIGRMENVRRRKQTFQKLSKTEMTRQERLEIDEDMRCEDQRAISSSGLVLSKSLKEGISWG